MLLAQTAAGERSTTGAAAGAADMLQGVACAGDDAGGGGAGPSTGAGQVGRCCAGVATMQIRAPEVTPNCPFVAAAAGGQWECARAAAGAAARGGAGAAARGAAAAGVDGAGTDTGGAGVHCYLVVACC